MTKGKKHGALVMRVGSLNEKALGRTPPWAKLKDTNMDRVKVAPSYKPSAASIRADKVHTRRPSVSIFCGALVSIPSALGARLRNGTFLKLLSESRK